MRGQPAHNRVSSAELSLRLWMFPTGLHNRRSRQPHALLRVLILPFAGEDALYRAYRFDEPWNGPNNSRLARKMPEFFACRAHARPAYSNYAVVVGPETAFPGARSSSVSQITDGTTITVLVVEVKGGAIPWMEPRDLNMPAIAEPKGEKFMAALAPPARTCCDKASPIAIITRKARISCLPINTSNGSRSTMALSCARPAHHRWRRDLFHRAVLGANPR